MKQKTQNWLTMCENITKNPEPAKLACRVISAVGGLMLVGGDILYRIADKYTVED